MKKIIFFLMVVIILAVAAGIWQTATVLNSQQILGDTLPAVSQTADYNLSNSVWIPSWGMKEGWKSLQNNAGKFSIISPVWYEANADGSLSSKTVSLNNIKDYCRQNNLLLVPTIALFDHEIFSGILTDPDKLRLHLQNIMDQVLLHDFAGIDLDYESTKLADQGLYFDLISKLSRQLHEHNKILIITVLPKWGDDIRYPSLPETRQVQDWEKISLYADQIRIMAYDYTYAKALFPGPIAPLNWVEQVLEYAVGKIPREKIILGVHLYAYEWWLETTTANMDPDFSSLSFVSEYFLNSAAGNQTARSYTYATVLKILAENKGELSSYQGEKIYKYSKINTVTKKKENRLLVFIDPEGIKSLEKLAKKYGIHGLVYWRLGDEGSLLQE